MGLRPRRSDRAPSLGAVKALSVPTMTLTIKEKVATLAWTSGISHCGLLPPGVTGRKVKVGSIVDRSEKYLLQTRSTMLR